MFMPEKYVSESEKELMKLLRNYEASAESEYDPTTWLVNTDCLL